MHGCNADSSRQRQEAPSRASVADSAVCEAEVLDPEPAVKRPPVQMQARAISVRSKLGQQLYELIQPDLKRFYTEVRDMAFGEPHTIPRDKRGNPTRGAPRVKLSGMQLFYSLMKTANADVDVSEQGVKADDVEQFQQMLKSLSVDELKKVVSVAKSVDAEEGAA